MQIVCNNFLLVRQQHQRWSRKGLCQRMKEAKTQIYVKSKEGTRETRNLENAWDTITCFYLMSSQMKNKVEQKYLRGGTVSRYRNLQRSSASLWLVSMLKATQAESSGDGSTMKLQTAHFWLFHNPLTHPPSAWCPPGKVGLYISPHRTSMLVLLGVKRIVIWHMQKAVGFWRVLKYIFPDYALVVAQKHGKSGHIIWPSDFIMLGSSSLKCHVEDILIIRFLVLFNGRCQELNTGPYTQ